MSLELLAQARSIQATTSIREMSGTEILAGQADYTRAQFSAAYQDSEGTPVFIPARNEAEDLPGTLLALARTGSAWAVVLDNKSTDETAAVAHRMGATVIEVPEGNKMAATQAGLTFAQEELGVDANALFIDADTLVVPSWTQAMRQRLGEADEGGGSAVFANSILWHGPSRIADVILSGAKALKALRRQLTDGPAIPRGHNYAVRLDREGRIAAAVGALDPDIFIWDDTAVYDALTGVEGARVVGSAALSTLAITRNDHGGSLLQRLRTSYGAERRAAYDAQYGPTEAYIKQS